MYCIKLTGYDCRLSILLFFINSEKFIRGEWILLFLVNWIVVVIVTGADVEELAHGDGI
jgi:hypothetical protein